MAVFTIVVEVLVGVLAVVLGLGDAMFLGAVD